MQINKNFEDTRLHGVQFWTLLLANARWNLYGDSISIKWRACAFIRWCSSAIRTHSISEPKNSLQ